MKKTFLTAAVSLCMIITFFTACTTEAEKDYYTKDEVDKKIDEAENSGSEVVAWGNITSAGVISESSGNFTRQHLSTGEYLISWSGNLITNTDNSIVIASCYSATGFSVSYVTAGTRQSLWFYTYSAAGVTTDCGFSFAVIKK